ncbi:MAG: GGDEF domain-containing protein [Candidatus Subteraquimicrobiales bacterium]|nr:GGDEF domain-containing protein [Candidatus Subteraquimicrobiales bacterium]
MQKGKYLRGFLLIIIAFVFANSLLYFSQPEGVLIYWISFVIPMVIAAVVYDVPGAVFTGLLSVASIFGWFYSVAQSAYLAEMHIKTGLNHHFIEILLGSTVFFGVGVILGLVSRKQKRQQAILERLSIRDRLTGLYNYSYFLDRIDEEIKRAERYEKILSFVVFDIDHFKSFNDTFGHEKGNLVLKKIANTLRESVRGSDIVARYGGEEFVAILPQTNKKEALKVAERVRQAVERLDFEGNESQPVVKRTISGGVSTYLEDARDSSGLIVKADEALYEAKRLGRNRVCCSC